MLNFLCQSRVQFTTSKNSWVVGVDAEHAMAFVSGMGGSNVENSKG